MGKKIHFNRIVPCLSGLLGITLLVLFCVYIFTKDITPPVQYNWSKYNSGCIYVIKWTDKNSNLQQTSTDDAVCNQEKMIKVIETNENSIVSNYGQHYYDQLILYINCLTKEEFEKLQVGLPSDMLLHQPVKIDDYR
jgi:hypothetical protein